MNAGRTPARVQAVVSFAALLTILCVAASPLTAAESYQFLRRWGSFLGPVGIAVDALGYVYVSGEAGTERIQVFTSTGSFVTSWGSLGIGPGQFDQLEGIAVDGNRIVYTTEKGGSRIQRFSHDGGYLGQFGVCCYGWGKMDTPQAVAVTDDGNVYVVFYSSSRVQRYTTSGVFLGEWGSPGSGPGQFGYDTSVVSMMPGSANCK